MAGLFDTYKDATVLQCSFIEKLERLDLESVNGFSDSLASFLSAKDEKNFVYGLAAGRSALSLYSFLQLLYNHFNAFPCTMEDPVQKHFRDTRKNLGIAVSGSGETPAVNKYIEDIINQGGDMRLITANEDGTAHRLVEDYENGSILVIKGKTKYDEDMTRTSKLSPMGTEFELEVLAFLNAVFKEIQARIDGERDEACESYLSTIKDFAAQCKLISRIDEERLTRWFERLFPRSGRYIIGGVGRSGLVARAFEMRFTHLNKTSYWERDFNTPSFQIGDVYVPITGSGNTYECLEGVKSAFKRGADVLPITTNPSSELVELMRVRGREDDIVFIPISERYLDQICGSHSTTSWLVSEYSMHRYPIFEINASIFTNSVVAVGAEYLGIEEAGMKRLHA
ncbi:MAG: sugar phosphate isomerase [Methanothrix sp.]|jgi:D-arabinose 5-phosphate isomerase GutQ|uniref:Sugar phosphate isomerase involved in capsule formation-like protein n=1 Tax=Methanothrix harundinacea TaxID=301375 RepID=A0A101FV02_9EURY|nr:MAG: Sugar phosphate isomerase involved in capsule formation-like protein [Methanothrix harundinacea]MDD3709315.1 sugar phosphate isomerase [Methanothrix sp.]MDD5767923.1 sugar phosphate isomerase [Methanothrix sp.]MDI9399425.1 sugar phosphate isomerase [Euryarchaeota archaeon]